MPISSAQKRWTHRSGGQRRGWAGHPSVYQCLNRYEAQGIDGLRTKRGQGRKPSDESAVSEQGYVPYGWQFKDDEVFVPASHAQSRKVFARITSDNRFHYATCKRRLTARFVLEQFDHLSFSIRKPTVVVLDDASIHRAKLIKEQLPFWQQRRLYLFYLPP